MAKRTGSFKKNVVEKKWAVLVRNEYGEEWVECVESESEYGALAKIASGIEVIGIEEYGK